MRMSNAPLSNVFQVYKFMGVPASRGANDVGRTAMSASGGHAREVLSARGTGAPSPSSSPEGTIDTPFDGATFTALALAHDSPAGLTAPTRKRVRKEPTNPSASLPLLPNSSLVADPAATDMAAAVQPDSGGAGPRVHCSGGQAAQSDSVSQGGIPALVAPTSAPASSSFTTPRLTSQLLATSSFPAPLNTTLSAAATGAADPTSVSAAGTTGDPACLHPQAPPFLTGICNPTPSTSPTDTSTRRKTTRGAVRVPAATGSGATSAGRRTRSGPSNPSSSGSPLSSFLVPAPPPRGVPEKLGDRPLRLVIVGHNPSAHAWQSGHYYSHPANHMWRLLIATGIAPPGTRSAEDDDRLPAAAGVGFLDVGCGHPGTDSASFSSEVFKSWSQVFYAQLKAHMGRASASIGCSCGLCGAPSLVAFSGKRHYLELLNVDKAPRERVKSVEHGPQQLLPGGWPFPATTTEVWVCSSTSGAAALTREQRQAPYRQLAEKLRGIEWPRRVALRCAATQFGGLSNTARTSVADVAVAVKAAEEEATMGAAPENETAALGAEVKEEVEVVVIGDGDAKDDEEEM